MRLSPASQEIKWHGTCLPVTTAVQYTTHSRPSHPPEESHWEAFPRVGACRALLSRVRQNGSPVLRRKKCTFIAPTRSRCFSICSSSMESQSASMTVH